MSTVVIDIPKETLLALKQSDAEVGETLRMAAAVKLFELGRLSSGAAAMLAGVPRVVFLAKLADYGVDTFSLTEEDLQQETRLAQSHLRDVRAVGPLPTGPASHSASLM